MATLERLSPSDLANLAMEAPDTPMHEAAFAVMGGRPLLDSHGHVRIDRVRRHVESRLNRVPELRRALRPTHPLQGPPLWVDDPAFQIEHHVRAAVLPPPGGEAAAMKFVEERMSALMDRSRPLWEIWLLEGYGPGRVGLMIKLHHALADGPAMVNLAGQIFDLSPDGTVDEPEAWSPAAAPTWGRLVRDNAARRAGALAHLTGRLRHPLRLAVATASNCRGALETMRQGWDAPRTSLNRPVAAGRKIAVVRMPLAEAKFAAHGAGATLNDVFLCVVAGGLRRVMLSRGEDLDGAPLRASIAVSLHRSDDAATAGNLVGTVVVPLPMDDRDPRSRLEEIAAASAHAKATQRPIVTSGLMVFLARTGFARWYIRRQHMINVLTTNLPGPPVPLYFAGARIDSAFAVPPIAGNVTVSFAVLTYAGTLSLSVVADASAWPDLDVLVEGLRSAWRELTGAMSTSPPAEGLMALSA